MAALSAAAQVVDAAAVVREAPVATCQGDCIASMTADGNQPNPTVWCYSYLQEPAKDTVTLPADWSHNGACASDVAAMSSLCSCYQQRLL
ncbi:hypothetical protein SCUCBS95973_006652 [Sporothrix curviconia]|uniref:Uncharacterized protein n=1 Tax=Sporothrix curviconia TaxID=1260050 RepID=A0ABP0C9E5_9PEZI